MSSEEREMLEALADRDGLSASDEIRQLIRKEYVAAFPEEPPKRRKR